MSKIERALIDYFESAGAQVERDNAGEWWVSIGDDDDVVSLTGAATAVLEVLQKAQVSFSGEEGK